MDKELKQLLQFSNEEGEIYEKHVNLMKIAVYIKINYII